MFTKNYGGAILDGVLNTQREKNEKARSLTLFRMGFFGAAHGLGGKKPYPP